VATIYLIKPFREWYVVFK